MFLRLDWTRRSKFFRFSEADFLILDGDDDGDHLSLKAMSLLSIATGIATMRTKEFMTTAPCQAIVTFLFLILLLDQGELIILFSEVAVGLR